MKKTIVTVFLLALAYNFGFSQTIIPEAASEPIYNQLGDPTTNILDANGARQGNWFYQDVYGNPVMLAIYQDHKLKSVSYPKYPTGTPGVVWSKQEKWESNEIVLKELTDKLKTALNQISVDLHSNQQLAISFTEGANIQVFVIGDWNPEAAKSVKEKFKTSILNLNLNISNDTFILI